MKVPAACGPKETDRVAHCCGAKAMGRLGPANLKPVPEADACEMVRLDLPVLVMATGLIKVLPTCTSPKLMLVEESVWAIAVWEMKKTENRMRDQQAGLHGDPGHI